MKKAESKKLADENDVKRIEVRAYALYEQRGGESGHELENWLEAEQEIRQARRAKESRRTDRRLETSDR